MRFAALLISVAFASTVNGIRISVPAVDAVHTSTPTVSRRALLVAPLAIAVPVSAAPYEPYTPSKPDAAAAATEKKRREAAWEASKTGWKPGFAVEYSSGGARPGAPPK